MTGRHLGHARVRGNRGAGGGRIPLLPEDVTVAEVLKQAGYATGITGKWGLGNPGSTGVPSRQGFDEWFGYLDQQRAHSYYPAYLWKNEEKVEYPANAGNRRKGPYSHDLFTAFALEFIRRHKDGPFFLYVPYCIPHARLEVPEIEPVYQAARGKGSPVRNSMITRMDRDVGKMLDLLKELGIAGNTLVLFCSDNGAAGGSSGDLRGRKRDVYEGGIRTPMVAWQPGAVPAGRTSEQVWHFMDFLPTCADLAGGKAPEGLDGVSIADGLRGKPQATADRLLYWEQPPAGGDGTKQAVRWRNWKLLRKDPKDRWELYDLGKDEQEQHDLAKDEPGVVAKLAAMLEAARAPNEHFPLQSKRNG